MQNKRLKSHNHTVTGDILNKHTTCSTYSAVCSCVAKSVYVYLCVTVCITLRKTLQSSRATPKWSTSILSTSYRGRHSTLRTTHPNGTCQYLRTVCEKVLPSARSPRPLAHLHNWHTHTNTHTHYYYYTHTFTHILRVSHIPLFHLNWQRWHPLFVTLLSRPLPHKHTAISPIPSSSISASNTPRIHPPTHTRSIINFRVSLALSNATHRRRRRRRPAALRNAPHSWNEFVSTTCRARHTTHILELCESSWKPYPVNISSHSSAFSVGRRMVFVLPTASSFLSSFGGDGCCNHRARDDVCGTCVFVQMCMRVCARV